MMLATALRMRTPAAVRELTGCSFHVISSGDHFGYVRDTANMKEAR